MNRVDRRRVLEPRQVTRLRTRDHGANRAPQHLGAARLRQRGRETYLRGLERRAERVDDARDQLGPQRGVGLHTRARHHEDPQRLALQLVGHADRGRLEHPTDVRRPTVSTSAGPSRFPATLIVSSERPCRNHCPSVARRGRSRRATTRPDTATSTSRGSARGSWYRPRVIPGHGLVHTSSPTSPRTGRPASSNTSTAMPSAGPPSEHGRQRLDDVRRQEARARPRCRPRC